MEKQIRRVTLSERVVIGKYVESSFWEAANQLGDIRMTMHSCSVEPSSGPLLIILGRMNGRPTLRGYVGYMIEREISTPLFNLRLPAGEHVELQVEGRLDDQLTTISRECGWDFDRVELEFLVNPLDYPEEKLRSIARVPLNQRFHRIA
ncbi:MAG: hypothetical protein NZ957_02245 [Thaumarchaeota archaeon]|nr:hypothetical protein [Candidatus Calditenuaceae archaeon]